MINIYFNHSFTETAYALEQLKKSMKEKICIFVTNNKDNFYFKNIADYFEIEKSFQNEKDYIEYYLKFCKEHKIDFFIPKNHVIEISKHIKLFLDNGIKVITSCNYKTHLLLNDKFKMYEYLKNDNISINIPPFSIVNSYEEFLYEYNKIKKEGFSVVVKPTNGIGGNGYRKILEISELEEFQKYDKTIISLNHLKNLIKNNEINSLFLSGYLTGKEYSIDCLANKGELINIVCRTIIDKHTQQIENKQELIKISQELTKKLKLNNLYNIQIRYHNNKIYLIEINTRMSGGIYKSCISGINLLENCILLNENLPILSNINKNLNLKIRDKKGYYVEIE